MRLARAWLIGLSLSLCACAHHDGFRAVDLLKTDIDFVTDVHQDSTEDLLEELLSKLYLRNPVQLSRSPVKVDIALRRSQLFAHRGRLQFAELDHREEVEAIQLGLSPQWRGDRVFAVMVGLTGLLRKSFNYQDEFFILSELDQQSLYNSARNIEILVWRLGHRRDAGNRLLILTNSEPGEPQNLSFERLFGKLIGGQDLLARVVADRTNRNISKVAQSVATMAFLP